jgi:5'-nucleotidase
MATSTSTHNPPHSSIRASLSSSITIGLLSAGLLALIPLGARSAAADFRLTILHNNDGESQLVNLSNALSDFGGAARFATLVSDLRGAGELEGGVVMLSSGDNFLAGPEFNASLENGVPFYDSIAMSLIGYDAICIGNHEFDFGPEVLADFITGFSPSAPFLSANLDVSAEPSLHALAAAELILPEVIIETAGEQVGIVGALTPDLPFISSPGAAVVDPDLVGRIQERVDHLRLNRGVDKIIVITHLQGISSELALAAQLEHVDVIVAGGGGELLANPGTLLIPDDAVDNNNDGVPDLVFGPYPIWTTDAKGVAVPIVTTRGDYRYVGRLVVDFDDAGNVTAIDASSGPVRVAGGAQPDAVLPDPVVQTLVVDPVSAALADLAATIVADSEVPLDGVTSSIRSKETNLGNLVADSMLWQARELARKASLPMPQIALQNGGGIRNNSVIPSGPLTALDTFSILPFANFVSVVEDVTMDSLKGLLENAVSRVSPPPGFPASGTGRFAQVAGFSFSYEVDTTPGDRVRDVVLDDGTVLFEDGVAVDPSATITVATINFLANGGDQYDFGGAPFTALGVSYQQALRNYLEQALTGSVTALDYPVGGEGRIVRIDNPADLNNDSVINGADMGILLAQWGGPGSADLNNDGVVDGLDAGVLIANWSGD